MKFLLKKAYFAWHAPTPAKWKKFGNSLMAASGFVTTCALAIDFRPVALIFLVVGALGKFVTEFVTEDDQKSPGAQ